MPASSPRALTGSQSSVKLDNASPDHHPPPPQAHSSSRSRPNGPRALSLRPCKLSNLPRKDALVNEALQLLSDSQLWKASKAYNGIQTYTHILPTLSSSHPIDQPWCCVKYEWPSAPPPNTNTHEPTPTLYTQLWDKMSKDRILCQQQYIPEIMSVTDIKTVSRSQSVWSVSYDFGSPLSPRICTMLQVVKMVGNIPGARTGIAINIPVDLNTSSENLAVLEDLGVKGRFVSVEHLKEYEGGRVIEWRKLMCGEFGGLIPRFCVRRSMPEKLAQDAQRFLRWVVQPEESEQHEEREAEESKPQGRW